MSVKYQIIDNVHAGQRLDNYLMREFKGVPKSRIYRAIRHGEVRVNKARCRPDRKLASGDEIRMPPLRQSETKPTQFVSDHWRDQLESRILIENNELILINKPSGMPVHGGSGVSCGLIEAMRQLRPKQKFLELVHRLDRETSGCLLIAKKRLALIELQSWFVSRQMKKRYWTLVKGQWRHGNTYRCELPLYKNQLQSGERIVRVDKEGREAITIFKPLKVFDDATLMEATLKTGRTHQIRVHLQALGHPIAGDDKYGDRDFNRMMKGRGLKRLFLQCMELSYRDHEKVFGACCFLDSDIANIV